MLHGLSVGVVLAVLAGLAHLLRKPLLLPPFGGTAVLMLEVPDKPIAQPRAVVGGYLLALCTALGCGAWLEPSGLLAAAAAGLVLTLMRATDTLHPPAVAALLLMLLAPAKPTWHHYLVSVPVGVGLVLGMGWLLHKVMIRRRHPAAG